MSKRQTKSESAPKTARKTAGKTTRKTTAKTTPKTTPKKPPAKSVTKTVAKKKTAVSKPVAPKPATRKETVATLRQHVDSIVTRLKTADTNTRKNVKSLETAIAALEKQIKSHQKIDHAELSERVDQLSGHLTRSISNTKRDIASDLKSALENPTVSGVEAAIERSEQRLADTEMAQARAISKVNKHLADLARVIDARFRSQEGETKENSSKIIALSDQVSQSYERIALIENTAADAIRKVGDEVVGTAETFQSKLEAQNAALRDRIEAIAARTKEDFDQQKTDLSRRMESIEDSSKNQSNYIDRSISKLAARIDSLEYGLSNNSAGILANTAASTAAESINVAPPPFAPPAAPDTAFGSAPAPAGLANDPFAPVTQLPNPSDDFVFAGESRAEPIQPQAIAPVQPETIAPEMADNIFDQIAATSPAPAVFTDSGMDISQPQEYQPQAAPPNMAAQHHYVDPAQAVPAPNNGQLAYNYDPYQAQIQQAAETAPQSFDYGQTDAPSQPVEYTPPIADADLPYENPGYSEEATAKGMSRPGHVTGIREKRKKSKKSGKPLLNTSALSNLPITPRNLRVAGLALALATVGYFGLRGFMGSGSPEQPIERPVASSLPTGQMASNGSTTPMIAPLASEISTSAPIGDYQDNAIPVAAATEFKGNQSLEQAADSGNAIAQFQLGISYLDAGRADEGIAYVRKAANQKQPAAQYRLAKLYEGGIGVASDPDMARQLTEMAARAGNRIAMHDLGLYYAEGRGGVERNLTTALSWFEKAAERGVVDSQYNLGILYGSTPEIQQDLVTSYVWFSVASGQGDQFAGNQLASLKEQMSADQLKQATARIAGFKPVAIDEAANGIFREVPWSMPGANSFKPTADLVRDAQGLLGQLGYDVGAPDGDMGPKTRSAVKAFEKANGLPESGSVNGSLIDRLEAAAGV